jgi:iron complex outermembrane receptor protein
VPSNSNRFCFASVLLAVTALLAGSVIPCPAQEKFGDLTQKSLEDLMNIGVTSVSKKEQKTSQVAASIFVISQEDIRRSGALNIPDLLRMVPGLDVAQIDAGKWAISARGINGQYSNKLLVMVDGRTVYTPIFGGVFWDSQNTPLKAIERIEVIRGPGAAVWGANAVNGIINIITKSAGETQGVMITAREGTGETGPDTIRYGGKAGGLGSFRVYAAGFHVRSLLTPTGLDSQDDWRLIQGGFRTDSTLTAKDTLTTEGEVYQGDAGELAHMPISLQPPVNGVLALRDRYFGWNLLTRWNRTISPGSSTSLQVYFDRTTRGDNTYGLGLNTIDIDFQHHVGWGARQDIVWGLGYRLTSDDTIQTLRISFTPADRRNQLFSAFAQDEIAIQPDSLHLSLGTRLEHNVNTGFDIEPSARLAWTPNSRNMLWSAVSGAVRTPARSDSDIRVNYYAYPGGPGGMPMLVSFFGNPKVKDERVTAFEAGYRNTWTSRLSLDASAFYNRYRDLTTVEPEPARIEVNPAPVHLLIPTTWGNGMYGETHGMEFFANWKASNFWTLSPGYALLSAHFHTLASSQDTAIAFETVGSTPSHQAQLRSSVSLPRNLQWNLSAYFVNRLSALAVPSYTRVDTGLTWSAGDHAAMSLEGQNLFSDRHLEFSGPDSTVQPSLMKRSAYVKISWSF